MLVDLGGGEGYFARLWSDARRRVVVDAVAPALKVARARGLDVIQGDVRRAPLRGGSVDLIVSSDVWEHLDAGDVPAALAEVARVLAPGGTALVHTSCYGVYLRRWLRRARGRAPLDADDLKDGHLNRFAAPALERMFAAAGLKIKKRSFYKHLFQPATALLVRLARGGEGENADAKAERLQSPALRLLNGVRIYIARLDQVFFGWWLPGGAAIYKLEK